MPIDSFPDLDRLEAEAQAARDQLARLEQEHADLVLEMSEFETLYRARVGSVQAQLEETQLHIEEYKLRIGLVQWRGRSLGPSQLEAEVEYRLREQRQRAEATNEQARHAARQSVAPLPPIDPAADLDLKQVYRELAKRTHPDLAADEADRAQRNQRMKDINAGYAGRELQALRQMLRDLDAEQQRQREDPAQRQQRLTVEYDRSVAAIRHVKAVIAELNHSPMMALKLEAAIAQSRGRDVLGEVARQAQAQLTEAKQELNLLIAQFQELVASSGLAG
jgi:hypothetical protein